MTIVACAAFIIFPSDYRNDTMPVVTQILVMSVMGFMLNWQNGTWRLGYIADMLTVGGILSLPFFYPYMSVWIIPVLTLIPAADLLRIHKMDLLQDWPAEITRRNNLLLAAEITLILAIFVSMIIWKQNFSLLGIITIVFSAILLACRIFLMQDRMLRKYFPEEQQLPPIFILVPIAICTNAMFSDLEWEERTVRIVLSVAMVCVMLLNKRRVDESIWGG